MTGRDMHEASFLAGILNSAHDGLQKSAAEFPMLLPAARALRRLASAASRPYRLAILGEANSGKSSIANRLIGGVALPASPIANTRLPCILYYAAEPRIHALKSDGNRVALSARDTIASAEILRVEVGLPAPLLRTVQLLDFPATANPLLPVRTETVLAHQVDAALWATVATQAWRETERQAWLNLPERIRKRSMLAVTYCDRIASRRDFQKLKTRLEKEAGPEFAVLCFLGAQSTPHFEEGDLSSLIESSSRECKRNRSEKALALTRKLASRALLTLGAREAGA
jgi:GTPase SAR1 family protein